MKSEFFNPNSKPSYVLMSTISGQGDTSYVTYFRRQGHVSGNAGDQSNSSIRETSDPRQHEPEARGYQTKEAHDVTISTLPSQAGPGI